MRAPADPGYPGLKAVKWLLLLLVSYQNNAVTCLLTECRESLTSKSTFTHACVCVCVTFYRFTLLDRYVGRVIVGHIMGQDCGYYVGLDSV